MTNVTGWRIRRERIFCLSTKQNRLDDLQCKYELIRNYHRKLLFAPSTVLEAPDGRFGASIAAHGPRALRDSGILVFRRFFVIAILFGLLFRFCFGGRSGLSFGAFAFFDRRLFLHFVELIGCIPGILVVGFERMKTMMLILERTTAA